MTISPLNVIKILLLLLSLLLSSCTGSLTTSFLGPALENMQQQSDVELVCEGTPPYLLMIDSLIASDPKNSDLLILGAKAYGGYVGAITECQLSEKRIQTISKKSYDYGTRLLSSMLPILPSNTLEELDTKLTTMTVVDTPVLFWGTFSWVTWVQQQKGSPESLADLSKIEKILLRIIELDETYQTGGAHFFLGAYYGARPKMFGGDPEKSKYHFEKALTISQRSLLIYQTTYAQTLARMTMDQDLHNALLKEVLAFPLKSSPKKTLTNIIAKRRAERLLQEDFFGE